MEEEHHPKHEHHEHDEYHALHSNEKEHHMRGSPAAVPKKDWEFTAQLIIVGVLAVLLLFNGWKLYAAGSVNDDAGSSSSAGTVAALGGIDVAPRGEPKIYGKELSIKYDDISANDPQKSDAIIAVLGKFDNSITLNGADLNRYIKVSSQISCEYCCGAQSIIFPNGQAACGCAHSYAMRGLAKYLIKNHGTEYTDDEILEELGKWKVLFFPEIHQTKAAVLKQQGIELNYINLASNKYRGAEKGQPVGGGSMVGGC
ncbi:MAG TPA: hypothetical protein VJG31_01820 [Candidatus Nanoarchaeia archaeon]|nr:hypothetical protein [Candidatus Nanoarchaeia archaeon]